MINAVYQRLRVTVHCQFITNTLSQLIINHLLLYMYKFVFQYFLSQSLKMKQQSYRIMAHCAVRIIELVFISFLTFLGTWVHTHMCKYLHIHGRSANDRRSIFDNTLYVCFIGPYLLRPLICNCYSKCIIMQHVTNTNYFFGVLIK
jgi:hypothetical protein